MIGLGAANTNTNVRTNTNTNVRTNTNTNVKTNTNTNTNTNVNQIQMLSAIMHGEAWEPRSDERVEMIGSGRSVGRVYQFIIDFLSLGCTVL